MTGELLKKISIFLVLFIVLVLAQINTARAAVIYTRGSSVTISWTDDQVGIEYYEIILVRDRTFVEYGPYTTTGKSVEIPRPKSGVYEVKIRGIRGGQYSEWCSSLGEFALLHTGVYGQWKVYFKLIGPSGPIIIY